MSKFNYPHNDFVFGQKILTLRTNIGMTQAGLAELMGVTRRTVGDWETGQKYPKVEHLKHFIILSLERKAFLAGREAEEVRNLWRAAHMKILLDEDWLAKLVPFKAAPPPENHNGSGLPQFPVSAAPKADPVVDWSSAVSFTAFYGREKELHDLGGWISEGCKVIGLLGLVGIGKSALAVKLMHQVAPDFEVVIWRSLKEPPQFETFLAECLQVLFADCRKEVEAGTSIFTHLELLLEQMRQRRILLVLDDLETLLEMEQTGGLNSCQIQNYLRLLRTLAETRHRSCLVFTSRKKPAYLTPFEGSGGLVRMVQIKSLPNDACFQIIAEMELTGSACQYISLIETYGGNPLALKIVSQTISDLFGGEIEPFLEQGEGFFGGVRYLLDQQFLYLSSIEKKVLVGLAFLGEPTTPEDLHKYLSIPLSCSRLFEVFETLHYRSLIEHGRPSGSFTLQPIIIEYIRQQYSNEIRLCVLKRQAITELAG